MLLKTRRDFLSTAMATCGMLKSIRTSAAQAGPAAAIPSWRTGMRQVAPNAYAYTQAGGPGIDNASLSNAGLLVGRDGALVIDTLGPPVHAKAFRAAAVRTAAKPLTRVVNTHHHRDHTNGNYLYERLEIVSHEYCRDATIAAGIPPRPYEDRPAWQTGMKELRLVAPTTTFTGTMTYRDGRSEIQLMTNAPAHTWGDVMVYLPDHRLLYAGDIAFFYVTPAAHNGHVTKWIDAIDRVMKMDVDIIVPGHGPVGTKKDLAETREYLELLANETRKRYAMGMSAGRAAADIDLGRFATWNNPERSAWNTVRLYAELNGTITPANDAAAQDAAVAEYLRVRRTTPAR